MATVTKGNVFADLGFDPAESADLALRTYLMAEIRKFIEKNNLTQVRAAKFFGIQQPRINRIMNGKVEEVSSDYLVGLLAKTGGEFRYSFKQPTRHQAEARLGSGAARRDAGDIRLSAKPGGSMQGRSKGRQKARPGRLRAAKRPQAGQRKARG